MIPSLEGHCWYIKARRWLHLVHQNFKLESIYRTQRIVTFAGKNVGAKRKIVGPTL